MQKGIELPTGFWYQEDDETLVLGLDEAIKELTGAFIELVVPEIRTILEPGEPVISIVGTDEDYEVTLPFRVEVLAVNADVVEAQNVVEREWLLRLVCLD